MADLVETLVAGVRSALAYLFLALYVGICAPVGMALTVAFHWKALLYVLGHGGVRLSLSLVGIRYRVTGLDPTLWRRPAVYCANHQSNVDPPVLFDALHPRLHVFYKAELDRLPLLGRAFRLGGFVPVDRTNRERAMAAIDEAAQSLRDGNSFLIFPEGTRSRTGELLPFKKGGFVMAIKAQVPIIPVAVQGGISAMRRGSAIVRPATVSIRVGEPVETIGLTVADRDLVVEQVRARLHELLAQGPFPD